MHVQWKMSILYFLSMCNFLNKREEVSFLTQSCHVSKPAWSLQRWNADIKGTADRPSPRFAAPPFASHTESLAVLEN